VSLLIEARIEEKPEAARLKRMRSRTDIMASILHEASRRTRKTRIMYGCNLSYRQLQRYLTLLSNMDLLRAFSERESRETRFFQTTEKGKAFLSAYRELKALMSSTSRR
jgi:predicted transcriptional regulator